ncbi:MAG: transposase [Thermodesulforhabdaceae bacterium]
MSQRVIATVETGSAYASEVKLLMRALDQIDWLNLENQCLIADKCYDSISLMEIFEKARLKHVIRVKETPRQKVGHPLRKASKALWKEYEDQRYLIESLFGTIKQKIDPNFRVKVDDITQNKALAVFVLYNMYLLVTLFLILLLFQRVNFVMKHSKGQNRG